MATKKNTVAKLPERGLVIEAPKMTTVAFTLRGTAPLVLHAWSEKMRQEMKDKQEAGPQAAKGKKRIAKDFKAAYEGARHISTEGWDGLPAAAFRSAMISACRVAGFQMTKAKLAVFVEADGYDKADGVPLVRITKGKPRYVEHMVRLATGVADIRPRPMWSPGWEAVLRVRFDADLFSERDVGNLLLRVGCQVGIGEGRPDSKASSGMGWGLFEIA